MTLGLSFLACPGNVLGEAGGTRCAAFDKKFRDQARHPPHGHGPRPQFRGGSGQEALPAGRNLVLIPVLLPGLRPAGQVASLTPSVFPASGMQVMLNNDCGLNKCLFSSTVLLPDSETL